MKTLLVLALAGQCYAGRGVVQQRVYNQVQTYSYAAPAYNQVYAVPYVEKVKFVAVEQPGYDYYAALAANASRSYERFQEYAQVPQQQAVTYSIPSPQSVQQQQPVQQPVYQQQQGPAKTPPSPQQPYQAQATPQQPAYNAPSKAPPQLQAPAKNPSSGDGALPPPIIQQKRLDYSAAMGDGGSENPPPPPVPGVPMSNQPQTFIQPAPVIHSVNSQFLTLTTKNCASCHTGRKSKGDFQMFEYPGRLANLTQDDLQSMYNQVASNNMPFKRTMSLADRQALMSMLSGNISSVASR